MNLTSLDAYRAYLEAHPQEWAILETLTPITISRFSRDRAVFAQIERVVLPAGPFDLVLCRNAAFAYFAPERQRVVLRELTRALRAVARS